MIKETKSMDNKILQEKNILITGATRGLGLEIAREFWAHGANLVLTARSRERLSKICDELMKNSTAGQSAYYVAVDLSKDNGAEKILEFARKKWDKLDILINNAGMTGPVGKVWENDWAEWKNTMQVNLFSAVDLTRKCIPWMQKGGGGKIISLSGGGATGPRPNLSAYALSKVGIVRFTEIVAVECADDNIQINCIAPGALGTSMMQDVIDAGPGMAGHKEYNNAIKVLSDGMKESPKAVKLCTFLASDASGMVSGKLISAIWDPWENLEKFEEELLTSDIFTLRRIVPEDRGKNWS